MQNYEYSSLFWDSSVDKQLVMKYDNARIDNRILCSEEFEFTESLCSEESLTFGCCEASVIKFRVLNVVTPLKGRTLDVSLIIGGHTDKPYRLGRFKITDDVPTADRDYRNITAYDAMYDIINTDVAGWYNSTLPDEDSTMTLKAFRTSFARHFGLEQIDVSLVNDDMIVRRTIKPEELSGLDVLQAVCELNGAFGHIGRDGKLEYVVLDELVEGLYPADDLYPANDLYPRTSNAYNVTKGRYYSCEYDDFLTERITQLQIRQEENDIGATAGTAGNTYIIEDNFLVYGMSAEELDTIAGKTLSVIGRISYRPFSADCIGNPCILLGEKVSLNTKREIITSYVLQRTLKGIQGMHDALSSEGVENYCTEVNSLARSIIQLKGRTNVLTRTVDETNEKITDVEQGLSSEISHTAAQVAAEVKRASKAEGELSGRITVAADSVVAEVKRASKAEGELSSSIKLNADNIAARVSKDSIISEINMSPEKIKIRSDRVEIEGYVEFSDLSGSGRTTINGDNITTGHLNADLITSGTIRGKVGLWVESDSSDRVVTINADGIYNAATTYLNDVAVYGSLKDGNGNDLIPAAVQYLNDGWWGNFTTANGWTVTVQNGVITDVG